MKIKQLKFLAVFLILIANTDRIRGQQQSPHHEDKMTWWKEAKFGMFMHWGLYSKTAGYWKGRKAKGSEHFMLYERIPWREYGKIADGFNPVKYDAEKWVLAAKRAGMKYLVITTKHHDGFAMYDSPSSDYNIKTRTPYGKDPMKELAAACHKHGIKLGFYYSLGRDWQDPDAPTDWPTKGGRSNTWDYPDEDAKVFNTYFERKVKPQVKELLTQYGEVAIMWFDTPGMISKPESQELIEFVRQIQPNCIINSRVGNELGDYKVTEQHIVKGTESKPWEACITMSKNWGYIEYDTLYKSSELMVRQLLEIVSKGGNLLLNNGPTPEGEIRKQALKRLKLIGKWMDKYSEGVYGTQPWRVASERLTTEPRVEKNQNSGEEGVMKDAVNDATSKAIFPEVRFTAKSDDLYAFVCSWETDQVVIKSLGSNESEAIKEITLLGSSKKIKWKQTDDGLIIDMPRAAIKKIPVTGFKVIF